MQNRGMNNRKLRACLYVLIASCLWGVIGIFVTELRAAGLTPMQIVAVRVTGTAVLYGLILLATDRRSFRIRFRDCYLFVCTGVVSFVFFTWCYFSAMQECAIGVAAIMMYTAPAIVALLSVWVFGERMTWLKAAAVAVTFAGCVLSSGAIGQKMPSFKGILFGMGSGFGYALYTIFSKLVLKKYGKNTAFFYTFLFASAASIPLAGFDAQSAALLLDGRTAFLSLFIAALCCLLPYLLYEEALLTLEAGVAATLSMAEPVVAALTGIALYREPADPMKLLGLTMIVGAVLMLSLRQRRSERRPPAQGAFKTEGTNR